MYLMRTKSISGLHWDRRKGFACGQLEVGEAIVKDEYSSCHVSESAPKFKANQHTSQWQALPDPTASSAKITYRYLLTLHMSMFRLANCTLFLTLQAPPVMLCVLLPIHLAWTQRGGFNEDDGCSHGLKMVSLCGDAAGEWYRKRFTPLGLILREHSRESERARAHARRDSSWDTSNNTLLLMFEIV